jgi:hypothetical protein
MQKPKQLLFLKYSFFSDIISMLTAKGLGQSGAEVL